MTTKRKYNPSMVSPPLFSAYHEKAQNSRKEDIALRKNVVNEFPDHARKI